MLIGQDYVLFQQEMEKQEGDVQKVVQKLQDMRKQNNQAPLYDCCQTRLRTFVDLEKHKLKFSSKAQVSYPGIPYELTPDHPWYPQPKELVSKMVQELVNRSR